VTDRELEPLLAVCRKFIYEPESDVVIPEPYVPYIPENWNGILVLAEAQNLSEENRVYRDGLKGQSTNGRILRLINAQNKESIGVQPWDDGCVKLALKVMIPDINIDEVAVSNAVPWSCIQKGKNANPTDQMKMQAGKFWKELFAAWQPNLKKIVVLGNVAEGVMRQAGKSEEDVFKLRLPSPNNLNRIQNMFDTSDLRKRFPEVEKAARAIGRLELIENRGHVLFVCHAVSLGLQKLQGILRDSNS